MTDPASAASIQYWDHLAATYQRQTWIAVDDFHFGPLIPGDRTLGLLPKALSGWRCLELGAGAGQNSIYLASQGAICTATDGSQAQVDHGRELAAQHQQSVTWQCAPMEDLPALVAVSGWDLIHSAYALPFVADPLALIQLAAQQLRPGGLLLVSLRHPVATGEWLEVDDDQGAFLKSYLHPPDDVRQGAAGAESRARAWPISTVLGWLRRAGLMLEDLAEPAALDLRQMPVKTARQQVPYLSHTWLSRTSEFLEFPPVLIVKASKPA
jgi:SAM-dependent methyltransferase